MSIKRYLLRSWILRLLVCHILASYVAWAVFLLMSYLVFGKISYGLHQLLLAPYYVLDTMIFIFVMFLSRFPYFDLMPPLSPSLSLWLSYIAMSSLLHFATWVWTYRPRKDVLQDNVNIEQPAGKDAVGSKKSYGSGRSLWALVSIPVAVFIPIIIAAMVFAGRIEYRQYKRETAPVNVPEMNLVYIPAGEFIMGSPPEDDPSGVFGERPMHKVKISRDFYMGATEVTQAQWEAVMGYNPSHFKGENLPVENISWNRAVKFCRRLSKATGRKYRLPTEAEWEYACRAGTQTRFSFGDDPNLLDQYEWWVGNSDKKTHPVGQKKPNAWGLYDMHGNVDEWCSDRFDEQYYNRSPAVDPHNTKTGIFRTSRGGSWWYFDASDDSYRSAARGATYAHMRSEMSGFRVVMEKEPE